MKRKKIKEKKSRILFNTNTNSFLAENSILNINVKNTKVIVGEKIKGESWNE